MGLFFLMVLDFQGLYILFLTSELGRISDCTFPNKPWCLESWLRSHRFYPGVDRFSFLKKTTNNFNRNDALSLGIHESFTGGFVFLINTGEKHIFCKKTWGDALLFGNALSLRGGVGAFDRRPSWNRGNVEKQDVCENTSGCEAILCHLHTSIMKIYA